jgi:hypothetical protein
MLQQEPMEAVQKHPARHCERSEAIHKALISLDCFVGYAYSQ